MTTGLVASDALPGRVSLDPTSPGPYAPCALLLDVSSSMGSVIGELNAAVQQLVTDLREHELAAHRADVVVVTYGSSAQVISPMTIARDLTVPVLHAGGSTSMGAAINLGLDTVAARQDEYRTQGFKANIPMAFNLTDGAPTDDWLTAAQRVRALAGQKKLHFFSIGTTTANMSRLAEISPLDTPPLRMADGRFSQLFKFISDSLIRRSSVVPGTAVSLPSVQGWAQLNG